MSNYDMQVAANEALKRYQALPLVERIKHDIAQQQSFVRGQTPSSTKEPLKATRVTLNIADVEALIAQAATAESTSYAQAIRDAVGVCEAASSDFNNSSSTDAFTAGAGHAAAELATAIAALKPQKMQGE